MIDEALPFYVAALGAASVLAADASASGVMSLSSYRKTTEKCVRGENSETKIIKSLCSKKRGGVRPCKERRIARFGGM